MRIAWQADKHSGVNCETAYIGKRVPVGRVYVSTQSKLTAWQVLLPVEGGGMLAGHCDSLRLAKAEVEEHVEEWYARATFKGD